MLLWFGDASDLCNNMMKRPAAGSDSAKLSKSGNAKNPHPARRDKKCATLATAGCHYDCLAGGTLT